MSSPFGTLIAHAYTVNAEFRPVHLFMRRAIKSSITIEADDSAKILALSNTTNLDKLELLVLARQPYWPNHHITYYGVKIEDALSYRDAKSNEVIPTIKTITLEANSYEIIQEKKKP